MRNKFLGGAAALSVILLASMCWFGAGCGKVSDIPLSPLINPPIRFNFDSGIGAWKYEPEDSPTPAGFALSPSTAKTFGNSAGSLKLTLNFTGAKQSFDFGMRVAPPVDLTGRAMSAWVLWDSGITGSPSKVIAKFYVKDNNWVYSSGPDATLALGRWIQVTWSLPTDGSVPTNPANIKEWGMEIYLDSGPAFYPGAIYVDNVAF